MSTKLIHIHVRIFQAATKAEEEVADRNLQDEANAARMNASDILSETQDLQTNVTDLQDSAKVGIEEFVFFSMFIVRAKVFKF